MRNNYFLWRAAVLCALACGASPAARAQSGGVGIGTTAPDASAALDITAADKGALLPRLSASARVGLASPAAGLVVFQTDAPTTGPGAGSRPGFWYNGGTAPAPAWVRLADSGTLSYDAATGLHVGPGTPLGAVQDLPSGTGTVSSTTGMTPYNGSATSQRVGYLLRAADLLATGYHAGPITSLGFYVTTKNSTQPFQSFSIRAGNTTTVSTNTPTFVTPTTPVYSGTVSTTLGLNTYTFSTPFAWDGTSNLYFDLCFDNASTSGADVVQCYALPYFSSHYHSGSGSCGSTVINGGSTTMPVLYLSQPPGAYALPAVAGSTGQVLTQTASGAVAFQDPQWKQAGTTLTPTVAASSVQLGADGTTTTGAGPALELVGPGFNTDPVGFYRQNTAANATELRAVIGDDATTGTAQDRFAVGTAAAAAPGALPGSTFTPRFTVLSTGAVVYSVQSLLASVAASVLTPLAGVVKFTDNGNTNPNGTVTLSATNALEGQQVLVANLDGQALPVLYSGGTVSIPSGSVARFVLVGGGWLREL